ncbi:hypothetical protein ACLOJK_038140 [Asimina triloba]
MKAASKFQAFDPRQVNTEEIKISKRQNLKICNWIEENSPAERIRLGIPKFDSSRERKERKLGGDWFRSASQIWSTEKGALIFFPARIEDWREGLSLRKIYENCGDLNSWDVANGCDLTKPSTPSIPVYEMNLKVQVWRKEQSI